MRLAGEHNALNATAAAALAAGQGIGKQAIQTALATFKSVKRRLEVRAEIAGITIIEDFAHHPTAIRETLRALRSVYPQSRLWAVLEPRSNTLRRKVLEADLVAKPAPRRPRHSRRRLPAAAHPRRRATPPRRRGRRPSMQTGTPAELHPDANAIIQAIAPQLHPGDVVALLSNGGFDGIYEKLPTRLRSCFPAGTGMIACSRSARQRFWFSASPRR